MTAKLEAFFEALEAVTCEADLQKLVERLRDVYDVDHLVYHAINGKGEQYAALTYQPEWGMHYQNNRYETIDPVVGAALRKFHPFDWKMLDWNTRASRRLYLEASDAGIGNQGFTVPIRGPNGQFAMLTANHNGEDGTWSRFTNDYKRDLLLISHFLHQKTLDLVAPDESASAANLSPRERDALSLIATGQSRGQVADILKISEHTLRVYLDTARTKLRALNTIHAVALAYRGGLITV